MEPEKHTTSNNEAAAAQPLGETDPFDGETWSAPLVRVTSGDRIAAHEPYDSGVLQIPGKAVGKVLTLLDALAKISDVNINHPLIRPLMLFQDGERVKYSARSITCDLWEGASHDVNGSSGTIIGYRVNKDASAIFMVVKDDSGRDDGYLEIILDLKNTIYARNVEVTVAEETPPKLEVKITSECLSREDGEPRSEKTIRSAVVERLL